MAYSGFGSATRMFVAPIRLQNRPNILIPLCTRVKHCCNWYWRVSWRWAISEHSSNAILTALLILLGIDHAFFNCCEISLGYETIGLPWPSGPCPRRPSLHSSCIDTVLVSMVHDKHTGTNKSKLWLHLPPQTCFQDQSAHGEMECYRIRAPCLQRVTALACSFH